MALFQFGEVITDLRGSIGGTTFTRNRYGPIMKKKDGKINKHTSTRSVQKTLISTLAHRWKNTLDETQRTSWKYYALNTDMFNSVGGKYHMSGYQAFLRANLPVLRVDGTPHDSGPATGGLGTPIMIDAGHPTTSAAGNFLLFSSGHIFGFDNSSVNAWLFFYLKAQQHAPDITTPNYWHYHGVHESEGAGNGVWLKSVTYLLGQLVTGNYVHGKIFQVEADGKKSEPTFFTVVVTPF